MTTITTNKNAHSYRSVGALHLLFLVWCRSSMVVAAIRRLPNDQRAAADRVLSSLLLVDDDGGESSATSSTGSSSHRRLASVDVPVPTTADEHLVTDLPLLSNFPTKHWAGLLPASNEGDKYLFYWLFAPDTSENSNNVQEKDIPLVIWLNGGPGCSSMDGLFLENGPLRFQPKSDTGFELVPAQYSWHKSPAYMLYIDQPVGTGLSFTTSRKYPSNDMEVDTDFYYFLQSFLNLHADKFVNDRRLHRGFYFSGESHAGHYIPSMMAYILDQNDKISSASANVDANNNIYIPLAGAAIGNGWVDPFHQYAAAHAAYGHGIIDRAQMAALDEKEKTCQSHLNQNQLTSSVCFNLLDEIVGQSFGSKSNYKVSQYDIRKVEAKHGGRDFPPGHKTVEAYLGGRGGGGGFDAGITNSALEAIHATPSKQAGQIYQECTDPPYDALSHQDGLGVVNEVVKILHHQADGEDPIRLLFFNGVTDLICNHVGNEVMLEQLPWKHQEQWTKAERTAWKSQAQQGDKISGYMKEFGNLLFLKIMESGHMVPMDVPDVALDMMKVFLYGGDGAFQFSPQSLDRSADTNGQCPSCPTCLSNFTNYGIDSGREGTQFANPPRSRSSGSSSSSSIQLWIGLGLAAAAVIGLIVYYKRRTSSPRLDRIPAYDLEMRGGTYFDKPIGDDDLDIAKETRED